MPTKESDNSRLASMEAFKAAFEVQAGISDLAFQELFSSNLSTVPDRIATQIQGANVVYSSEANSLSRVGRAVPRGGNMRLNGAFKIKANKVGSPQHGRFSSESSSDGVPLSFSTHLLKRY